MTEFKVGDRVTWVNRWNAKDTHKATVIGVVDSIKSGIVVTSVLVDRPGVRRVFRGTGPGDKHECGCMLLEHGWIEKTDSSTHATSEVGEVASVSVWSRPLTEKEREEFRAAVKAELAARTSVLADPVGFANAILERLTR